MTVVRKIDGTARARTRQPQRTTTGSPSHERLRARRSSPRLKAVSVFPVVVLATDDAPFREALSDFLTCEGYLVREADDVSALRRAVADDDPYAVIIDVTLDRATFDNLLTTAHETRLVMLSRDRAKLRVADERVEWLQKPLDLDLLLHALAA